MRRQPDESNEFIFWLFRNRCVGLDELCYRLVMPRDGVSHIIPVSRKTEESQNWRNKVLHCPSCHSEYHHRGVSDEAIKKMQERRAEHLEMIGRSEYI